MRQPARLTRNNHVCVFGGSFIREQIDPRVKRIWEERFGAPTPFGRLRRSFRETHCSELNPYDSSYCPYPERSCAIAFYQCVEKTVDQARDKSSAVGYFRRVSRTLAGIRADDKPLARDYETVTHPKKAQEGPRDTAGPRGGDQAGQSPSSAPESGKERLAVRRDLSTPLHIGSLLRGIDLGPREGRAEDGEAGPER